MVVQLTDNSWGEKESEELIEVELVPTMMCELEKVSFRWNARSWKWKNGENSMLKAQLAQVAFRTKPLGVKKDQDAEVLPMKSKEDTVR